MGRYEFIALSPDRFELIEDGTSLVVFTRGTFRQSLTSLGRSSQWIGSILRLFLKRYPPPVRPEAPKSPLERVVDRLGESGLADYLRSKGMKVVKPLNVSDWSVIEFLESKGYFY